MSEQPYKVALIRISSDRAPEIAISADGHRWYTAGPRLGSQYGWHADHIEIIRPLVVLDPEDHKQVAQLLNKLQDMSYSAHACGAFSCLAEALRSLARPPKPPEPTGDGAVVEDRMGHRWVRIAGPEPDRESKPWRHRGHTARTWEHVNAVRVLSEGVRDV